MSIETDNYAVRATVLRINSKCPVSGRPIPADLGPYGVFSNRAVLHPQAARRVAPELAAIAEAADREPAEGEAHWAVTPRDARPALVRNTRCPVTGGTLADPAARPYEVSGGEGHHLSVNGGEDAAPALAEALHAYYQTDPAPRGVKTGEPKAAPARPVRWIDEEREAAAEAEALTAKARAGRRAAAVKLVAEAIGGRAARAKAEKIVNAVELLAQ